jgi:uncharacterized protein YlaI
MYQDTTKFKRIKNVPIVTVHTDECQINNINDEIMINAFNI